MCIMGPIHRRSGGRENVCAIWKTLYLGFCPVVQQIPVDVQQLAFLPLPGETDEHASLVTDQQLQPMTHAAQRSRERDQAAQNP